MRLFALAFVAIFSFSLTACGSTAGSDTGTKTNTTAWTAPRTFAAAVAASATGLAVPPSPADCQYLKVMGTPGTVLIRHQPTGYSDRTYTARADSNYVSTDGYLFANLVPPRTTIYVTLTDTNGTVEWIGADFISADGFSATYTAPDWGATDCDNAHIIRVNFTPAPTSNG